MADDYNLYDGEPPAQKHSDTSQAAAARIKKKIGPLHTKVIMFLLSHPHGATDEEMQIEIPMAANTQRPRRRELQLMGIVVDSGQTRMTMSECDAVVWVLRSRLREKLYERISERPD